MIEQHMTTFYKANKCCCSQKIAVKRLYKICNGNVGIAYPMYLQSDSYYQGTRYELNVHNFHTPCILCTALLQTFLSYPYYIGDLFSYFISSRFSYCPFCILFASLIFPFPIHQSHFSLFPCLPECQDISNGLFY